MTRSIEVDEGGGGGTGGPNDEGFVEVAAAVDDVVELAVVAATKPVGNDAVEGPATLEELDAGGGV